MDKTISLEAVALTIAGSDSGGGAGIQADLKTFEAHGVFGTSAITAITAQNSVGVQGVMGITPEMVGAQIASVTGDFRVGAAKTGMLLNAAIIQTVQAALAETSFPLVVDPVMVATSGDPLLQPDAMAALAALIRHRAQLITPNLHEAQLLTGLHIHDRASMVAAADRLAELFPQTSVLVKGGHLTSAEGRTASDYLRHRGEGYWMEAPWIDTSDTHGTGCTLSAAITAQLVRGLEIVPAVQAAKRYLHAALAQAWSGLGHGHGSLRHQSITTPTA
jgi:hydroxymethylpyrimidine kinase/phosphomethylpyrimidine kinase